jgi:EpsI family protein
MKNKLRMSLLIGAAMLTSAALTKALTPTVKIAASQPKFLLEEMIPASFGEWKIDTTLVPLKVDESAQRLINELYDQTLSRTYVNRQGEMIMLSIAYGGNQSRNLAVHKPEVCYAAQGFDVQKNVAGDLPTPFGPVPVKRLLAVQGERSEPITYWITLGDRAVSSGMQQRLQKLSYGLSGKIPDGVLVRVSNISRNEKDSYKLQEVFVSDLLSSLTPASRLQLAGEISR